MEELHLSYSKVQTIYAEWKNTANPYIALCDPHTYRNSQNEVHGAINADFITHVDY